MEKRMALKAVMAQVDWLFSERILEKNKSQKDILLNAFERENNQYYVYRKIDTTNKSQLKKLAKIRLLDFLKQRDANTFELFQITAKQKALQLQGYFVESKADVIQQEYYFNLQRWIEYLSNVNEIDLIDTRFWLTTFVNKLEQATHEYISLKNEIDNNGYLIVKSDVDTVKIFTPELALILTSKALQVKDMDSKTERTINGNAYLRTYITAFKEGEQYFETDYKVSPNTLYGENAEQYVRDLHLNYFHILLSNENEGWQYVKKKCPCILTHTAVKELGYYSGIVNKVDEQVKKHPRLFATFDKCEHSFPPQLTEDKAEQESIEIKPVLKPEAVQIVFEIIKDFFDIPQQNELKLLLETGKNVSNQLIFLDNGNRLADCFKQLKKADVITRCNQKELESWICTNFKYRYRKEIRDFTVKYLNDIISTNKDKCQKPLLNVTKEKATGEIRITKA